MSYFVELGVYINCHISGVEETTVIANSKEEAEALAQQYADEREKAIAKEYQEHGEEPPSDIWVQVEGVYAENE